MWLSQLQRQTQNCADRTFTYKQAWQLVSLPSPRAGRADFPHPVLHTPASLKELTTNATPSLSMLNQSQCFAISGDGSKIRFIVTGLRV